MYIKSITYTDYRGNERTEEFCFNLSQSEIVEMEYSKQEKLSNYLQRIVKANNEPELIKLFKDLVLKAYGEISDDGKRFMKADGALAKSFAETEAYTTLFMELAKDSKAAADFVNGIMPKVDGVKPASADNITKVN